MRRVVKHFIQQKHDMSICWYIKLNSSGHQPSNMFVIVDDSQRLHWTTKMANLTQNGVYYLNCFGVQSHNY